MVDKLKRKNLKKIIIIISVIILILMFAIIDTFTGYANISFKEVLLAIFNPKSLPNSTIIIVRKLRLPIAIMAILVGMSLGSSGALMQTILHNPLASPYTLGIGAGASFGASLGILFGFNDFGIVHKPMDKLNNLEILYKDKFINVNVRRLKLKVKAKDLYPENYDLESLFVSFKKRKLEKDLQRGSKKALKKIQKEIKNNR